MNQKIKINVIGDILNTTGYASHTRQLFNALYKVADVTLSTQLVHGWERMVNDAELDAITKPHNEKDMNLIVTTPHNWKSFIGLGKNIGYCVWEGDKVPTCWIDEFLNPKIDLIFVPSEHTKQAILNTLNHVIDEEFHPFKGWIINKYFPNNEDAKQNIINKIKVIPHGVDLSIFKKQDVNRTDKFTFICNKGWRGTSWDRGGVQYLLKAFNEEFSADENVELLVKLNPAYVNEQQLQMGINMLRLEKDRGAFRIFLNNSTMEKLNELYNQGDVYICPTRAESFDLGSAEAMACGLPVIATGYGGQIEHMKEGEDALFVKYILSDVKEDLMYEGIKWADIDIFELRKKMRWCFEHQNEVKEMGIKAKENMKNWTWDKNAEKIVECVNSLIE